jgi:hypothetical protein
MKENKYIHTYISGINDYRVNYMERKATNQLPIFLVPKRGDDVNKKYICI